MFKEILSSTVYRDGLKGSYTKSGLDYIKERGGLGGQIAEPSNLGGYVLFSSKDITGNLYTVHFFREGARIVSYKEGRKEVYFYQYNK